MATQEDIRELLGNYSVVNREIEDQKSWSVVIKNIDDPRFQYTTDDKWRFNIFDFPIIKAKIKTHQVIIVTDFFQIKCEEYDGPIDDQRQLFIVFKKDVEGFKACRVVLLRSNVKGWELDDVTTPGLLTKSVR